MVYGETCSWDAALMCRLSLSRREEGNDNVAGVQCSSMRLTLISPCNWLWRQFLGLMVSAEADFPSAETWKSLSCIIKHNMTSAYCTIDEEDDVGCSSHSGVLTRHSSAAGTSGPLAGPATLHA